MEKQKNTPIPAMSPSELRKARRKEQNIQDIQNACFKLLLEKSVEELSMDEIAKEAGFGKGSLYNHFNNKEDLVKSLLQVASQNFIDQASEIAQSEGSFKEKLFKILTYLEHVHTKDKCLIRLIQHIQHNLRNDANVDKEKIEIGKKVMLWFTHFFEEGIKANEIPINDPQRLASLAIHIFPELELHQKLGLVQLGNNVSFLMDLITGAGGHREN